MGAGLCPLPLLLGSLRRFSRLLWRFYLRRDPLQGGHEQAPGFGVGLALGFELLPEVLDTAAHLRYEWPRLTVLSLSCRVLDGVLSWPAGVQQYPHAPGRVLLVGDGPALHALSDGVHGRAEMVGGLRDANALSGWRSCRVLSSVLSHTR
jgi:hypothetical protein